MSANTSFPPQLKRGSTIGIVAPSGRITDIEKIVQGIQILHEMGFNTKFPSEFWPGCEYLADKDEKRGEEFNEIWNDPQIDALMAARGGYGCVRMAHMLEVRAITQTPKLFIGFSDITVLHTYLNSRAEVVTLHGPTLNSLWQLSKKSLLSLQELLFDSLKKYNCQFTPEILQGSGSIRGKSTGGNLATIISTLGTPYEGSWKKKIVFLEDTNEPLYRIDRMLTQLYLAGKFSEASAIVLGNFSNGLNLDSIESLRYHEAIWKRVIELTPPTTTIWADFPIGHGTTNHTIPFGAELILDNSKAELSIA